MAHSIPLVSALNVLLVEDDPFFRRVISDSLSRLDFKWHIHAVGTAAEAMDIINTTGSSIDLTLIDLGLPDGNGLDLIQHLGQIQPEVRMLVISANNDEAAVMSAIRLGAVGYIVKGDSHLSITNAVQQVLDGLNPLSPQLAGYFLKLVEQLAVPNGSTIDFQLTRRELELLRLFATGKSYSIAAKLMGVSLATIQTHARNLYRKLGVHSGLQAVVKAQSHGLL